MQKPVILQVIPRLDTGGAELSALEMVDALVRAGARALVATEGGRMEEQVGRLGGELVSFAASSKNPLRLLENASFLTRLCRAEGVMLVHARSRAPAWSALLAARRAGVPYVTTYHGAYNEVEPFKRLYNSVMARGDRVIANSRYTADLVMERHKPEAAHLSVIYRGVDVSRYRQENVEPARLEALRIDWGIEPGQKVVLHPARLTNWKGQAVVVEAAGRLLQQGLGQEAVFILAGDHQGRDDYRQKLMRRIDELGLGGQVRLVGHCSDMAAAYALAHVTLIASIEPEAFGRTSAEAQAMGCPVIATNIGAPPETVRAAPRVEASEITGWLVPPEKPEDLAEALQVALTMEAEAYEALGVRARRNVIDNYTDVLMKQKTLAVYDQLLGTELEAAFNQAMKTVSQADTAI